MSEVTITSGEDTDEGVYVTVSIEYLSSLVRAKKELKALKATLANGFTTTHTNVTAEDLLADYPELVDYSGMSSDQAMDTYPDLFDYEVDERDC